MGSIPSGGALTRVAKNADARQVPDAMLADIEAHAQGLWGSWGNLLINGDMAIAQRGPGPFVLDAAYTADRWQLRAYGGSAASVDALVTAGGGLATPAPCREHLHVAYTHAGGGHATIAQKTEAWPALKGLQVAFSALVFADTASTARLYLADGIATVFSAYHTGDNATWQRLDLVATVSPSATTVEAGLYLAGATCGARITGARLVVGSQALDFAPRPLALELALCQRYYEVQGWRASGGAAGYPLVHGYAAAAGEDWFQGFGWRVQKGGIPAMSLLGTWLLTGGATGVSLAAWNEDGYALHIVSGGAGQFGAEPNSAGDVIVGEWNPA